jgi:hypothetical protein
MTAEIYKALYKIPTMINKFGDKMTHDSAELYKPNYRTATMINKSKDICVAFGRRVL